MSERYAVIEKYAKTYRQSTMKGKQDILNTVCELTEYNRKYAIRLLGSWGKRTLVRINGRCVRLQAGRLRKKPYTPRDRVYDETVKKSLIKIWEFSDYLCGKRLVAFIRVQAPCLQKYNVYEFSDTVWNKLMQISPASVDRLLHDERKKYRIRRPSWTGSGSGDSIKKRVPLKVCSHWDNACPGFVEVDLVSHCGGDVSGDHCWTLTVTDSYTQWTENRPVPTKARKWTLAALADAISAMPFPVHAINSDNGKEFLGNHLFHYCKGKEIQYTRSRPRRKNDNCHVEQKNDSVVRRTVGYLRYDSEEHCAMLKELYEALRLWVNYFLPSARCIEAQRNGGRVSKKYDIPTTPMMRVLESKHIPDSHKRFCVEQYKHLDIVSIKATIERLQDALGFIRKPHTHSLRNRSMKRIQKIVTEIEREEREQGGAPMHHTTGIAPRHNKAL